MMNYNELANLFSQEEGIEISTMMGTPCLRYKGDFVAMMFDKEESLIIKVSPERVNELVANSEGNEFNYTGKRFKEWALIPVEFEDQFQGYINEAITYSKSKK